MDKIIYKAFVVREVNDGYLGSIEEKDISLLPPGEVLIKVEYSSLNYKDALSATGSKGVTKNYPHTPGIDAAGVVAGCSDDSFIIGDKVIVTGYDLGMNTSGGYQEYIRVPSSWVVKCPEELSLKEAMMYGTAGFTAALSVYKLLGGRVKPDDGKVLVTGATGGVGSIAVAILGKLGYSVTGVTGKPDKKQMLMDLGAEDTISREDADDKSGRPLLKSLWAGVIDTVGGNILSTAIKSTKYNGVVTSCGNAMSPKLDLSVFPFILRGVSLLGVDSVQCPMELRKEIWQLLATDWKVDLSSSTQEISLVELNEKIEMILKGGVAGRYLVKIG